MFYSVTSSLPYYRFSSFDQYAGAMQHAVFTRHGGVSEKPFDTLNVRYGIGDSDDSVTRNREMVQRFFEQELLGARHALMISANQTHRDHIMTLRADETLPENVLKEPHEIDDIDAFITDRRDILLLIQVADCQPVLLFDPGTSERSPVLGVVHSGWRGSVQNIIGKTVARMRDDFGADPSRILAGIGPSIGTCCSFFTDPAHELLAEFHTYILPDLRVDFLKATRDQLTREGVPDANIEFSNICTVDTVGEFFSYRKEGRTTGRFGLVAGLV